ncbi:type I pantothenate kinase [Streptomyces sp. TR06-5]|uniref:type I pantothenate kinase n=1 Tax=Streptomyces sp. TR06-5 TaxID=3385976 RepID=UPI0039A18B0E
MTSTDRTPTPYRTFDRATWSALGDRAPLPLSAEEAEEIRGLGDVAGLQEVRDVHLPLSRLLGLHVTACRRLREERDAFLGTSGGPGTPFLVGIAGSVAVGKSTIARLLRMLLARLAEHPRVELVATDGFLLPNAELRRRGLMARKGFPESYDQRALLRFVADVKAGHGEVRVPVYSHLAYDVVPGEHHTVRRPDILLVEGLNVLQAPPASRDGRAHLCVADYFDFSVYVDAATSDIERWYLERFHLLRRGAFRDPASHFHRFAQVSESEATAYARHTWRTLNEPNLRENIAPTRGRADLVLHKGPDHLVRRVSLRRL